MSEQDDITNFICEELSKVLTDAPELSADTDMTKDVSVDSMATMNLVFALEEKFDISIPLNALADIRKISELTALVIELKAKG